MNYPHIIELILHFLRVTCLPFKPPAAGVAVVCFCASYEGPMVPRSYSRVKMISITAHKCSSSSALKADKHLIQQAKLGVLLLGVFAARVRVFFHQENISLFTLENNKQRIQHELRLQSHIFWIHVRIFVLSPGYHRLHDVVRPRQLPRPLTRRHALPVFIDERYDVLQPEITNGRMWAWDFHRIKHWASYRICNLWEWTHLVFGEHGLWVLILRSGSPCQVCQGGETHLLQIWTTNTTDRLGKGKSWYLRHIWGGFYQTPTGLFPEEVGVAAVMAHVAVKHVVGHKGKTGSVAEEKVKEWTGEWTTQLFPLWGPRILLPSLLL